MTDLTTLSDLPFPSIGDYLLSWRGSAAYRLNLNNVFYKDSNGFLPSVRLTVSGSAEANLDLHHAGAPTNLKYWRFNSLNGTLTISSANDTYTVVTNRLSINQFGSIVFGDTVQNIAASSTSLFIRASLIAFQDASASFNHAIIEAYGITPGNDNTKSIGSSVARWNTVFATTGAINTSDEREKQWRGSLNDFELSAAKRIAAEIGVYQWLDAIAEKGENGARLHVGVRAQKVFSILESCGLDWRRYAWACHDKWDERQAQAAVWEKGQLVSTEVPYMAAGDRYGVRPDQLALFLIAAQEQRLAALEARIFDDGR